jgi:hypothetical protein
MNPARSKRSKPRSKPFAMGIKLALAAGVVMALVAWISVTASHPESGSAQTVSQPNIIYIVTDDMRYPPEIKASISSSRRLLARERA